MIFVPVHPLAPWAVNALHDFDAPPVVEAEVPVPLVREPRQRVARYVADVRDEADDFFGEFGDL
jgi:hypothetical protein